MFCIVWCVRAGAVIGALPGPQTLIGPGPQTLIGALPGTKTSQLGKVRGRGLTHLVARKTSARDRNRSRPLPVGPSSKPLPRVRWPTGTIPWACGHGDGTRRVKDPVSSGGSTVCYLTLVLKAWGLLGPSTQDPLLGPPSIAGFCSPPLPKPVLLPNQLPSTSQGRDEFNRPEQEVTFTAPLKIKDEFSSQTKPRLVHTSGTHPPGGHLATAGQWEACVLEQVGSTAEGSSGITLWMQTPQRPDVCMAEEEEEQEEEVQEVLYMHSNVAVLV
ncbi:unnamed protein product [Arctogadus glacialis]